VLGRLFEARALRELLMDAIRYGELPEVREALFKVVDNTVDRQHIVELLEERALVRDTMDVARVAHICEEMERAAARRLQPHFIRSFFLEARTGNTFAERNLWIARLDMLSRNPELQARLRAAKEWDLIICDEAHRMAASYTGGEVKYSKRYQLGQVLGMRCRHLLLLTATPHNGKEEDFQRFMALLDGDRFEASSAMACTRRYSQPDAPIDQGGAAQVRRRASLSRAPGSDPSSMSFPRPRQHSTPL
jgi:hypothetical protein